MSVPVHYAMGLWSVVDGVPRSMLHQCSTTPIVAGDANELLLSDVHTWPCCAQLMKLAACHTTIPYVCIHLSELSLSKHANTISTMIIN